MNVPAGILVPPAEAMTKTPNVPALAPPPVIAVIVVDDPTLMFVAVMAVGPAPLP